MAIDEDMHVLPYPKPLSMIDEGSLPGHKTEYAPDELCLGPTPRGAKFHGLVELRRSEHDVRPQLIPVDVISGLFAALSQTSSIDLLDKPLDRLARVAVRGGGPWSLHYREISDCVDLLVDLVERPHATTRPPSATWRHIPPPSGAPPVRVPGTVIEREAALPATCTVQRSPWTDALESEGRVLLLLGSIPALLNGIGATTWLHAESPKTVGALTAHVFDRHRDGLVAAHDVALAISDLVTTGLLEVHDRLG